MSRFLHHREYARGDNALMAKAERPDTTTPDDTSKTGRTSGSGPAATVAAFRQDDDRRRDEARIAVLQNQVDELRAANRELASRQTHDEETIKQTETLGAQLRLAIEQLRQESQQTAQARALDENRTRQLIQELETRIDDGIRPVRSLQAHVSEILESSRRKVDETSQ